MLQVSLSKQALNLPSLALASAVCQLDSPHWQYSPFTGNIAQGWLAYEATNVAMDQVTYHNQMMHTAAQVTAQDRGFGDYVYQHDVSGWLTLRRLLVRFTLMLAAAQLAGASAERVQCWWGQMLDLFFPLQQLRACPSIGWLALTEIAASRGKSGDHCEDKDTISKVPPLEVTPLAEVYLHLAQTLH